MIRKPSTTTAIKLASIAVHAEELAEGILTTRDIEGAVTFDAETILSMMADPAIQDYLASFPPALLPVKRS